MYEALENPRYFQKLFVLSKAEKVVGFLVFSENCCDFRAFRLSSKIASFVFLSPEDARTSAAPLAVFS